MGKRRFTEPEPSGPINILHGAVADAELDLHEETADSARQKVEWFLERWGRDQPGGVVRIITGKGNRSAEGPVLLPMVRDLLNGAYADRIGDWITETSGGSVLVRLKGEGVSAGD